MKHWWVSKTEIVAMVAAMCLLIQAFTGTEWFDAKIQAAIVVVAMFVLRFFTNQPVGK